MVAFVGYTTLDRDTQLGTTYAEGCPATRRRGQEAVRPQPPGPVAAHRCAGSSRSGALLAGEAQGRGRLPNCGVHPEPSSTPPYPFRPLKTDSAGRSLLLRVGSVGPGGGSTAVLRRNLSSRLPGLLRELARLLDTQSPTDTARREIREMVLREAQKKVRPGGP